jgi:DnaK suppressor protein
MSTKTKILIEPAADATSAVSAPKKKGAAKTTKVVITTNEPLPVELPESAKTVLNSKSQSLEETPEPLPVLEDTAMQGTSQTPIETQGKKWQEIKIILEKLKEDTLREIRKSVKNGTEAVAAIEPGGDIYDQASSERDRELGLLLGDREREKIHSIDEALLRIAEGDYGTCEECDEDIPLGRLKAMPFTRHCVKCKSDLEKLQAQTKRVEEERAYREIPLGAEEEES